MRHRNAGAKLGRTTSHRKAMFRNMVTSILKHERIRTTDAKAKAIRGWVDHLITLAKRGDLHARRQALAIVREKAVVHRLFDEAPGKFGSMSGGYTRVIKEGIRKGDAAPMSIIELVTAGETLRKKASKKPAAAKTATPTAAAESTKSAAPQAASPLQKASTAPEAETVAPGADTETPEAKVETPEPPAQAAPGADAAAAETSGAGEAAAAAARAGETAGEAGPEAGDPETKPEHKPEHKPEDKTDAGS